MPFIIQKFIRREDVRENPHRLYVFGDNLRRVGLGGQAKAMRGEPNAVGIPTKHAPSTSYGSYFADTDFDDVKPILDAEFSKLEEHLKKGGVVVFPQDGIGTGRAELRGRAPTVAVYISEQMTRMLDTYGSQ